MHISLFLDILTAPVLIEGHNNESQAGFKFFSIGHESTWKVPKSMLQLIKWDISF